MAKFRILWEDAAGLGRFQDIEADTMLIAIWCTAAIEGEHATFVDAEEIGLT